MPQTAGSDVGLSAHLVKQTSIQDTMLSDLSPSEESERSDAVLDGDGDNVVARIRQERRKIAARSRRADCVACRVKSALFRSERFSKDWYTPPP